MSGTRYSGTYPDEYGGSYPADYCGAATLAERIAAAGVGTLIRHWEVPDSSSPYLTLNGGNVAELQERISGGTAHFTQATAGNQPAYNASGGPNGTPSIEPQGVTRWAGTTGTLGHAAGLRLGIYMVIAQAGGASLLVPVATCTDIDPSSSPGHSSFYQNSTPSYVMTAKQDGVALQVKTLTSPAHGTGWQRAAIEYLASGTVGRVGNTAISPAFTGTAAADTLLSARLGHPTVSGGKFAFLCIVDNAVAGTRSVVDTYLNEIYNLGLT